MTAHMPAVRLLVSMPAVIKADWQLKMLQVLRSIQVKTLWVEAV
jgi:hypothetical protein